MITEDYVSYEIAKMLKEKGFEGSCIMFVDKNNERYDFLTRDMIIIETIPCPTLQMAMKWLREKHKIDIFLSTDYPIDRLKYTYTVVIPSIDGDKQTDMLGGSYDTYEQAVEAALKYSLQNLI